MQCKFQVGQKVTPVKTESSEAQKRNAALAKMKGVVFPEFGEIYTIRDVCTVQSSDGSSVVCVRLVEIMNDPTMHFSNGRRGEIAYRASCFRPVVERGVHKGMSILRELLNKQPQTVREDA